MEQTKKPKSIRSISTEVGTYVINMSSSYSWEDGLAFDNKVDWEADPVSVQGYDVVPYGTNNNLPVVIRNLLDDNNLATGILDREQGLLHGKGFQLYQEVFENGQYTRKWLRDEEIWSWLDDWDHKRFLDMSITEYKHLKGVFVRWYRNRGPRIGGKGKITELKVIPGTDARLIWPESGSKRLEDVTRILTGDFENNCIRGGVRVYPVFNPKEPFKHGVSMNYNNTYSFGRTFYSTPSIWSSRHWIKQANDVVETIKYFAENAINSAYHIQSPGMYWTDKREQLEKDHPDWEEKKVQKKLDEIKDEIFKRISNILTGKKNAGKFIETVSFHDDLGNLQEWKITPIDQAFKDFIEPMLKVAEKADSATTSGMGLHPGLSNIIINGKLNSGSELLYALKLYNTSDVDIPEGVVCEAINRAIKINFPGKNIKGGFYRQVVEKEQEITPTKRTKENA